MESQCLLCCLPSYQFHQKYSRELYFVSDTVSAYNRRLKTAFTSKNSLLLPMTNTSNSPLSKCLFFFTKKLNKQAWSQTRSRPVTDTCVPVFNQGVMVMHPHCQGKGFCAPEREFSLFISLFFQILLTCIKFLHGCIFFILNSAAE